MYGLITTDKNPPAKISIRLKKYSKEVHRYFKKKERKKAQQKQTLNTILR